jgi:hypothetical protein
MKDLLSNDVAKEVLTVISNYDEELLNKLPDELLKELSDLAADSEKEYHLKENVLLKDQDISEDCKDILAILYYNYQSNEDEKNELIEKWLENDINN